MPPIRVVVTGMGAVSCFGAGVANLWHGLVEGASGQAPVEGFDSSRYRSSFAAEVPWEKLGSTADGQEPGLYPEDGAIRLSVMAANEALADAGLTGELSRSAGCIVGSLSAHARANERLSRLFNQSAAQPGESFPDADCCLLAYQLERLVGHFRFEGPATLVSTACSSATDAIGYAADFIRSGESDLMLAGGVDVVSEMVHAGFNAMFTITTDKARPFDKARTGFFMGEGAGMVVLERLEHALQRGARIYAELLGYGLSNTAFHLTATSEDGAGEALAIRRCLADAHIDPALVDYLNAHGTATSHNDVTEVKAVRSVFGERAPRVAMSSIKPNIGHCMGAAGALEAVATIKCIEKGFIPATLNSTGDLDEELRVAVGEGAAQRIRYAVSQSFGFGGACSAVLFGAPTGSRRT